MKKNLAIVFILLTGLICSINFYGRDSENPKISFSFDDGSISDYPGYSGDEWNQLLLNNLKKHKVKAVLFVKGIALDNKKGKQVIRSWDDAGHLIGNHTYNHPYFNSKKVSLKQYKMELEKNESLINGYTNFVRIFRFTYLKEGNTIKKRDGFRAFLKESSYRNGHVTIDNSDWYINNRLIKRLKEDPNADVSGFKNFYIRHIYNRAVFYDSLAFSLTKRRINHNLLLHHNLAAALFLDELIQYFKDKGWEIVDTDKAYEDEIYREEPKNIPAGESLIWALAKQSGKYDKILRYPAEDSRYEKEKMDKLGL